MSVKDRTPVRPITIFHIMIVVFAYVVGDGCARVLNHFLLPSPLDWLPLPFGILGILLLTKPALSFLRRWMTRHMKKSELVNPKI
jgi:hypothetical protein